MPKRPFRIAFPKSFRQKRRAIKRRKRSVVPRFRNIRTGGFTGMELKFYDTSLVGAALTSPSDMSGGEHNPSATICLNSVTQGDGENQRDGRKMTAKSIYVTGNINIPKQVSQAGSDEGCTVFIALVHDAQTNGALLNSEDVFINPSGNGLLSAQPLRNLQFTTRFKVLATKKISIQNPNIANNTNATGNLVQQGLTRPFVMYKSFLMNTLFTGTTQTIANISDNSLSLVAWTSNTNLAPTISYNARLRFIG